MESLKKISNYVVPISDWDSNKHTIICCPPEDYAICAGRVKTAYIFQGVSEFHEALMKIDPETSIISAPLTLWNNLICVKSIFYINSKNALPSKEINQNIAVLWENFLQTFNYVTLDVLKVLN